MRRSLRVTSPYMQGKDVKEAQGRLAAAGFLAASARDGVYGPVTANATKRAKRVLGYPLAEIIGVYGSQLDDYLAGRREPSRAMRLRAAARRRKAKAEAARFAIGERAADRMVGWYKAGWKEHPAGSNFVLELSELAKRLGLSSYYSRMGFPWCALAVFSAALAEGSRAATLGLKQGRFNALYTPEIQSVANRGAFGLSAVAKSSIRKGVGLLFDFDGGGVDHVGFALGAPGAMIVAGGRTWKPGRDEVVTVEGNTSYDSGGSQANGGCVAIRIRPLSEIATAFRIT